MPSPVALPVNGQFLVPAGGHVKVPTLRFVISWF
jgi:hypothetical protein